MYGTGHVGRAIARLLATIDCRVDWIDEREEAFPFALFEGAHWPSHIRTIAVDALDAEVRNAPPEAYYLVLMHDHERDARITEAILRRGDFGFLGLLGSARASAALVQRFEQRGVAGRARRAADLPDRPARHRRQGAGADRDGGGGAVARRRRRVRRGGSAGRRDFPVKTSDNPATCGNLFPGALAPGCMPSAGNDDCCGSHRCH